MIPKRLKILPILIMLLVKIMPLAGQISPGELAQVHAHLEGLSNCTKCHTLGEKVTDEKCLDCHTAIKFLIDNNRGYHVSKKVKGKQCYECHNDHHGRNFQIVRFDPDTFNHDLTGYRLEGAHAGEDCKSCHKKDYIDNAELLKKDFTWLGLEQSCLTCHADYHQGTLSASCMDCHSYEHFSPAPGFDHANTDFKLLGKHAETECVECHEIIERNGESFQVFSDVAHASCTDCHEDVHNNKFGQNCTMCHNETSFHQINDLTNIDHDRTAFPLEGKHKAVDCRDCHNEGYLDPVPHNQCLDCHEDFHGGQFIKNGKNTDCAACHNMEGFQGSTFTIERHNETRFPLEGAHMATPCFICHKTESDWIFRDIGLDCIDCHDNIHEGHISDNYYPDNNCTACHDVSRWRDITFDHNETDFTLEGAHASQSCRQCHFREMEGQEIQRFKNLGTQCTECHHDIHYYQFDDDGITSCIRCHGFNNWTAEKFNHDKTRFPLTGKHKGVACDKCHFEVMVDNNKFIQYKTERFKCEDCH
jgi:hypothetical protein